jgi:ribosome maturation factor RimP
VPEIWGRILTGDRKSPVLFTNQNMIDKNKIQKIAESTELDKEFIIVDIEVKPANKFTIFLESLDGITISDCVKVSRHIEEHFNRDEEDYELNVSSAGLDKPLKAPLQFIKNIGREVEVVTTDDKKMKGILKSYNTKSITLLYSEKEKADGSKKKKVIEKEVEIESNKIKTVTIVVSFK